MTESSEKAMEVNNELRWNVDELQDDKKCKKKSNIDDADEVQEITAAKPPMKKNKHVCLICNKTLALKNEYNKHIKEDHTELCWHYCGKTYGNKRKYTITS